MWALEKNNGTWDVVQKPKEKVPVGFNGCLRETQGRWINGTLQSKACCKRVYLDTGIDYQETVLPLGFDVYMDLEEEVYMDGPLGFDEGIEKGSQQIEEILLLLEAITKSMI